MDWHGNRANYVLAKSCITMNVTPDDYFMLNWDLSESYQLAKQSVAQIVPFLRKQALGLRALLIDGWLTFDGDKISSLCDR